MRRLFPTSGGPAAAATAAASEAADTDGAAGAPEAAGGRGGTAGPDDPGEWSIDALADAYAYPDVADLGGADTAGGTWLRANMVASLDGAASHEGRSQPLSCAADMRVFGVLRGLADAVVVGAETVRKEGYRPARRRPVFERRRAAAGQSPVPAVAVVSAGLDLDFSARLFTEPLVPTLLVTGAGAPPERVAAARRAGADVVFAGEGTRAEPARVAGALAERGLRRLLTEGGPRLLGQFVAADALDELCLTVAPRLTAGAAPRIADGPSLDVPADFRLSGLLEEDGFLFTRYRRGGWLDRTKSRIGQSAE